MNNTLAYAELLYIVDKQYTYKYNFDILSEASDLGVM